MVQPFALGGKCVAVEAAGTGMDDDGTLFSLSGHGNEKQQGTGNGFHFSPPWPSRFAWQLGASQAGCSIVD